MRTIHCLIYNETNLAYALLEGKTLKEEAQLVFGAWQCGDIDTLTELIFKQRETDIIMEANINK